MNQFLTFAGVLALAAHLPAAAQTAPVAAPRNPTPGQAKTIQAQAAEHRAATYEGPRVVGDSKVLGRKFIRNSKPADGNRRLPAPRVEH